MTRKVRPTAMAGLLLLVTGGAADAQAPRGNPVVGKQLGVPVCGRCHATSIGAYSSLPEAPSLYDYVQAPAVTALSLRAFLRTSHPTMPNYILREEEIDDLTAWLLSLRRPR